MASCLDCARGKDCLDFDNSGEDVVCASYDPRSMSYSQDRLLEWRPCDAYLNGWCTAVPGKAYVNVTVIKRCPRLRDESIIERGPQRPTSN
jgi:hypothetical protein